MSNEPFDPYRLWLGIPAQEQPPSYYRLLGLQNFESNIEAVHYTADRQIAHVRYFQTGQYAQVCHQIINEIQTARNCLADPRRKAEYDALLRRHLGIPDPAPVYPYPGQAYAVPTQTHAAPPAVAPPTVAPPAVAPPAVGPPVVAEEVFAAPVVRRRRPYRRTDKTAIIFIIVFCLLALGIGLGIVAYFMNAAYQKKKFEPPPSVVRPISVTSASHR